MKQALLLLVLAAAGYWVYLHYFHGEPILAPPERRLAREGTFFVLQYTSVPVEHGVVGFEPGREVHFVRPHPASGTVVVTDGQHEVEMRPSELTNDLDVAAVARRGDEDGQRQITALIERNKDYATRFTKDADTRYAQELERINARNKLSSVIGAPKATPGGH